MVGVAVISPRFIPRTRVEILLAALAGRFPVVALLKAVRLRTLAPPTNPLLSLRST
jgi:hypothetical protein